MARDGRIRVPEFQRAFRWDSGDVLALFDSILKGYPVGSVLLWRKEAPERRVTLGGLIIDAPARADALWVVDGQQRITSLVNAVSPDVVERDSRFRVLYLVEDKKLVRPNDARGQLAIPLPDLFDIPRLLTWLQKHPEAFDYAPDLQDVTARLRKFALPGSVVEQADEKVLRDIFDRMNTAGKRLRSAEIFDAIHRAVGEHANESLSVGAIADRLAASTTFGRIDTAAVYQAILVRRHPDITRDPHGEFDQERRTVSDFPGEDREEGYRGAEEALERTIQFLTEQAGVPHATFLAYRFLLLIPVRFFALFPSPDPRNVELLSRWFWRAAARAQELNLSGSTATVRSLAGNIKPGEESQSVQRLLDVVESQERLPLPNLRLFRANQAASRITLCALWSAKPRDLATKNVIGPERLALALEGRETPTDVALEIVRRDSLPPKLRLSAANRYIGLPDDEQSLRALAKDWKGADVALDETVIDSLLVTPADLDGVFYGNVVQLVESREARLESVVHAFLESKTGIGLERTRPLTDFDFDDDDEDDEGEGSDPDDPGLTERVADAVVELDQQ
ncbi:hypothetical protein J2Y89_000152 [Curtobacterium herbarum]|uniref:DUF262 domain-containing protein n=1 Tax=Curtobacterium herbarum TaxID=150122 RepID=UPI00209FD57A|nr:DUF262 domain-containing protein [Curtobacterium herbarum]MCP1501408.1 hypothetical protein [Curtobacterium herbarum]